MERSGLTFEHFCLLILPWSTLLWHRCYYPHLSKDALSPVCGIFLCVLILGRDIREFIAFPPQTYLTPDQTTLHNVLVSKIICGTMSGYTELPGLPATDDQV